MKYISRGQGIDDDPQLLPITLNSAMQSFKDAAQTDAEVMQHVMDVRSGMPVDVRRHQVSPQLGTYKNNILWHNRQVFQMRL
ncbi:hypothetical protein ACLB1Q_08755 [Escherichia coli]